MILVCGDYILDRYWYGEITRVSEGSAPILKVLKEEDRQGGAANVVANIQAMGAACVGRYGPQNRWVTKIRQYVNGRQVLRTDFDREQFPIPKLDLGGITHVVFVDYGKGTLKNVQSLIQQAKGQGCTVLVDPKGHDYEKYAGADLLKPNIHEMQIMVGGWKNEEDLAQKAQEIRKRAGIGNILLTRAAAGMSLYGGRVEHVPALASEIEDVSGAGETALAAMAVALKRGMNPYTGMFFANKAASVAVSRFGTTVVEEKEVF